MKRWKPSLQHQYIYTGCTFFFCARFLNFTLDTYLPKDIASQGFIQSGVHVYEFKKVQALSMFLHHHLEVVPIFKHLQHLETKDA